MENPIKGQVNLEHPIMYGREQQKEQLREIFLAKAFLKRSPPEEPFKLASGAESYIYFDCKPVTQDPKGLSLIAEIIFEMIMELGRVDAIGGIETGAIPICSAVAMLSFGRKRPVPAFWVRQERKIHGTGKWIEGNLQPNSKVVIVDDVTTKGNSVEKAVQRVQEMKCEVLSIISLVDREEGARQKFESAGLRFAPIFTKSDFKELY